MTSHSLRQLACLAFLFGVVLSPATAARAAETIIDASPLNGKKVRLDGRLREWPKLNVLSERISGRPKGDDPRALGTVGYDDNNLYVIMRIKDARIIRTAAMGSNEDHAVLRIAFPTSRGFKNYKVRLYPGVPGKSAGAVKMAGGGRVRGAKIVEAPAKDGMTFEASIPWDAFPQARRVRGGLRGSLAYVDADSPGRIGAVVGTSKRRGRAAPALTLEAEYSLHNALVFRKGLSTRADKEVYGNVVGDQMLERLAVYGRYLTVTGWNYRGGTEFYYQDLQLRRRTDLKRFELRDFTGDKHDDLFVQRRVGTSGKAQELLEVWQFRTDDGAPQLIFQHQVGIVAGESIVRNQVKVRRAGGKLRIVVSQGKPSKVDATTWDAAVAGGSTLPALLPWQTVKSKTYEWQSGEFQEVSETSWTPKMDGPGRKKRRGTRMWSGTRPPPGFVDEAPVSAAPTPRPPTAAEKMDRVYALYRSDRGVRRSKPRFDFVTNVASDATHERVLVHGKDLVVFGKGFKAGRSYAYTTIGVKKAGDVLDVTARDITGDGRAEIIVRGVVKAQASKRLGGDLVSRSATFIYKVGTTEIRRIFAVETARSVKKKRVVGQLSFVPAGRGFSIHVGAGRAIGWTQSSYPFPQDKLPYGGLEPLLLPWSDLPARTYRYEGGAYKRQ